MGLYLEKRERNPLRKQQRREAGEYDYDDPRYKEWWTNYIKTTPYDQLEPSLKKIRDTYEQIAIALPPRAEVYLDGEFKKALYRIKLNTTDYKKIYEKMGVQVLVDTKYISKDVDFSENSIHYQKIVRGVDFFLRYITGILPNRKPIFIISDFRYHPQAEGQEDGGGFQINKRIFIDWRSVADPIYFVHEYAHYVADLIPSQSIEMLERAFDDFLNIYFRKSKRKKIPADKITDKMRARIAKKLGFPEYGILNKDEFFAMVVEHWRRFPNNSLTYRFKSLVKTIINRL